MEQVKVEVIGYKDATIPCLSKDIPIKHEVKGNEISFTLSDMERILAYLMGVRISYID